MKNYNKVSEVIMIICALFIISDNIVIVELPFIVGGLVGILYIIANLTNILRLKNN